MFPPVLRSRAISRLREWFAQKNLHEAWTPLLTTSPTLEPYLDAFTVAGYFLPTSPEFGLKKIMPFMADSEGVYEIAHAFRREEGSPLHSPEFTMVEWYIRNPDYIALGNSVYEIVQLLSEAGKEVPFSLFSLPGYWLEKTGQNLPVTCNDASETEDFSIRYDELVAQSLGENSGLSCFYDFPSCVRGMAKLKESGYAMRIECFLNGVEIANGYREMSSPDDLRALWQANNAIRSARGEVEYPLDEMLIELTPHMENVSGMALGLERVLMQLYGIPDIKKFYL